MSKLPADLYVDAQKGIKLSQRERRQVITYLDEAGETPTNSELAKVFQVDEKVIRRDRSRLLRQYGSQISPTHAIMFVAKYVRNQEQLLKSAKLALSKATQGTLAHQNYLKLCSDLEERILTKLQSIGVVPKELGHMTVTEEKWVAEFADNGVASVRPDDGASSPLRVLTSGEEPIDAEIGQDAV